MSSPFIEELQRRLAERHLSWRKFADLAGYHPSWLSKVRHGAPPSAELVRRCDEVLEAGGLLVAMAAADGTRPPAQLPAPSAGFVGRDGEVNRVRAGLIRQAHTRQLGIVAIDGPPGVGKTAIALHCCHSLKKAELQMYADGELYADLHGYSQNVPARPVNVLEDFLVALGVRVCDIPEGVERRAKLYRSLLASRRMLIMLDNAASSAQVEPLLPGSPGCGVIVTSRRRLAGLVMRVGAVSITLGPMTRNDSQAVLRTAIGVTRASAEATHMAILADQCGRLPLALRIAAERLVIHPDRPIIELVEELSAERHRLDGLATDDAVAVRTVFEWSYHDLSEGEAQMFRLLSLHRGPHFGVHAAASLAGTSAAHARRLLDRLAAVHLLEGIPSSRYHFHDLVRAYAAERVESDDSAEDRSSAVRRLIDWYLHTTAAAGRTLAPFRLNPLKLGPVDGIAPLTFDDSRAALDWCDTEVPNFVPIIRLAMDCHFYEPASKVAVALFDYLRLLRQPGLLWLSTTTLAREAAQAAGDRYALGWVETSLAEGYRWLRKYRCSQLLFRHALALHREIGDRPGEAWALAGLGFLAVDRRRLEQAHDYAQKALPIFQEVCDRHGEASALFTLADAYHGRRSHDDALTVLKDALQIFEEIRNYDGQGLASAKMADVHVARGEYEAALTYLEQSLRARRIAGSRGGEADGLARRALVLQILGRCEEARESFAAALARYEEIDSSHSADVSARPRTGAISQIAGILAPPGW